MPIFFWGSLPEAAFAENHVSDDAERFSRQYQFWVPFLLELKLEAQQQEKRRFWEEWPLYTKLDKCWAWYNGSIYMAYTEDPRALSSGFGQATRDVLVQVFEPSDTVKPKVMGPSPLHTDIEVIAFTAKRAKEVLSEGELNAAISQPIVLDNRLVVLLPIADSALQKEPGDLLLPVYLELTMALFRFYEMQCDRIVAMYADARLSDEFKKLRAELGRLQNIGRLNVLEHWKSTRSLASAISRLTLLLVDSQQTHTALSRAIDDVRTTAMQSQLSAPLLDSDLQTSEEPPVMDTGVLVTVLERLDSEVGRRSSSQAQLVSAITGGIAGAGLTLLVALLSNLFGT